MLAAISRALEERDQTQGHGARVAALAEPIAQALGWDADRVAALRFGAPLHDIGKVSVPREVLRKPGPLSLDELAEVRTHPQAGAELVLPIRGARSALPYVLFHHERWDGQGYPSGIRGRAIPVEARLLAVADAYDAMASRHASRIAGPARCPASLPWESNAAPARIMAIGFATSLPWSAGAVPCAASAMIAAGSKSSSKATRSDSEPAIEPKSGSTRSERMSPSRFSVGITSGSPAAEITDPNVAAISCGSYRTSGCLAAAASISSLSIPSYTGLTVYFGPPKTLAPLRSAWRNANSETAWQMRRSIRSVRNASSSSPSPSRHSVAP